MSFGEWIMAGAAIALGFYLMPIIVSVIALAIAGAIGAVIGIIERVRAK